MPTSTIKTNPLTDLYEQDETAWLETMSLLAAQGRHDEMDYANLSEFLADTAKRDRREVRSRLAVLMSHLLKCEFQPEKATNSRRGTIVVQRSELRQLLESGTLRNHAAAVIGAAYQDARKQATAETGLASKSFPAECGWDLDFLLADDAS